MELQSKIPRKLKIIWVKLWQKTYPETVEINGVVISVTPETTNKLTIKKFIIWDKSANRFYGCIDYLGALIPHFDNNQAMPIPGNQVKARLYTKPQFFPKHPCTTIKHPESGDPVLVLFNETAEFSCSTN